jgi:hypothetical protein
VEEAIAEQRWRRFWRLIQRSRSIWCLYTKIGLQALEIDFLEWALTKAGLLSGGK